MNTRRKSIHQSVVMSSSHRPEFLSSPNTTRNEIFVWGGGGKSVRMYVCTCMRLCVCMRTRGCTSREGRLVEPRSFG